MKLSVLFLFISLFSSLTYAQSNDSRLKGLEQDIESLIKIYNAVGLSVSIVEGNEILYSEGFGYRDLENRLPVNKNTVFPIASSSKAFTASLLGMLEFENKISLKDKPSLYIPKLQFYTNEMDNQITIEDLLSHKSGLGNLNGTLILFPENDRLKIMEKLKYIKPEGKVKDSWIYSNMGYTIAGTIVEQVTNETWDQNIHNKILTPLEMSSSYTDFEDMKSSNNFSYGYGLSSGQIKKVLYEKLYDYSPAGGIKSSSNDLANWMIAWLNNGEFKGKQVLPIEFIGNATTAHNVRPNKNEENVFLFSDGLGWRMESNHGNYKVYHGGNTSGFSSLVLTYPFKGLGITVLTNQQNSILPYIVAEIIKDRMLGLPKTDLDKYPVLVSDIHSTDNDSKAINTDKKPTHELAEYSGKYLHKGYGTFEVAYEENVLFVIFPRYKFRLEHMQYNTFRMKTIEDHSQEIKPQFFELNFLIANNGSITATKINLQSELVEFLKQPNK